MQNDADLGTSADLTVADQPGRRINGLMRWLGLMFLGVTVASCSPAVRTFSSDTAGGQAANTTSPRTDAGEPGIGGQPGDDDEPATGNGGQGGKSQPDVASGLGGADGAAGETGGDVTPPTPTCDADLQTDRRNCGECGNVCFAPKDCRQGKCSICANGCAVLTTNTMAGKQRGFFGLYLNDWFTPIGPMTMTAYVATGEDVVVAFTAYYEEQGPETSVSRVFNTGDWLTLELTSPPAKGAIAGLEISVYQLSKVEQQVTVLVEEVLAIPDQPFEFERSAETIGAGAPWWVTDMTPYDHDAKVEWLGTE